jgi:hypothetical protein
MDTNIAGLSTTSVFISPKSKGKKLISLFGVIGIATTSISRPEGCSSHLCLPSISYKFSDVSTHSPN